MTDLNKRLERQERRRRILKSIYRDKWLYILLIPVLANFIIFHYIPFYGIQIAFKRYDLVRGISGSRWVGLANFKNFFSSFYARTIIGNTFRISILSILIGFPIPITFAILLNELRSRRYKKFVQTVSYLPYFISVVVVVSIVKTMVALDSGVINVILERMNVKPIYFLGEDKYFFPIYMTIMIWRYTGFDAIIYIASISTIDPQLYQAAEVDGAGRISKIIHITIPSILPTIIILFILRMGNIMNVGWQTILLISNSHIESVSEVIQTFVYKRAFINRDFSYATAVGLFQSVIAFVMIITVNKISKKVSDTYLF